MDAPRIGIFDSGVGGLSVLTAVRALLPGASLHYVADSAHAPYGEQSDAELLERSLWIVAHLVASGAQAIVVACNTATAAAGDALRSTWPALPIIGVEPGVKPAVAVSRSARIGIMATAATLSSSRFARLLSAHRGEAEIHVRACTGLAAAIESGRLDGPVLHALIGMHCRPLTAARVDTVVLGCTHYGFAREAIQAALGAEVTIVDTASAVARQVAFVCAGLSAPMTNGSDVPTTRLQTSGNVALLRQIARDWLGFEGEVSALAGDRRLVPRTGIEPVRPLSRSGGF